MEKILKNVDFLKKNPRSGGEGAAPTHYLAIIPEVISPTQHKDGVVFSFPLPDFQTSQCLGRYLR